MSDANLSECVQTGQNGSTDPGGVFPFWRCEDLDFDVFQRELLDFIQEPITKSCVMKCEHIRR